MITNEKVLVLKQNSKPVTKIITPGKRIQYELKNDSTIHHGHIQKIQTDSFVINNDVVFLSQLKMIHGRPVSLEAARIAGGALFIVGTFVLYIGISALRGRIDSAFPFPSVILTVLGSVMLYFGIIGDLVGIIPFLLNTKTYNLEKDWTIGIGKRKRNLFFRKSKPDCCE